MTEASTLANVQSDGVLIDPDESDPNIFALQEVEDSDAMPSITVAGSDGYLTPAGSSNKIHLEPNEETLLMVLYLRVRDAASENPILGDVYASNVINRVDCDFNRSLFTLEPSYITYIAGRGKKLDDWTRTFLNQHKNEETLVLHLACGLDSRNMRVDRGFNVEWIDVDRPQVTDLRQRLVPTPPGNYKLLAASIASGDNSWLASIPRDKRTLIVMEGLTMYLEPEEGKGLFRELSAHFPHGHMIFDTIGSLTAQFTSMLKAFRSTKASIKWGIDSAKEIEAMVKEKRLRLVESISLYDHMNTGLFGKNYPPLFGGWTPVISLLPSFKKNGHFWHFEF